VTEVVVDVFVVVGVILLLVAGGALILLRWGRWEKP
jgi:hypothetical protein